MNKKTKKLSALLGLILLTIFLFGAVTVLFLRARAQDEFIAKSEVMGSLK